MFLWKRQQINRRCRVLENNLLSQVVKLNIGYDIFMVIKFAQINHLMPDKTFTVKSDKYRVGKFNKDRVLIGKSANSTDKI